MTSTLTSPTAADATTGRRATWALWGTAAGALGVVANLVAQPQVTEADRAQGAAVVEQLTRGAYHLGAAAGLLAVACLVLFAAGFRRWAERQGSESLALHAVAPALLASAGALVVAYGVKGQLAAYLDGGFNDTSFPQADLYTYFLIDDLAGFFGWWGVAVAAGCLAVTAFRDRLVVRWVGALGGLVLLASLGFLLAFGFTGFAGVVAPVFLVLAGIGLALRRE